MLPAGLGQSLDSGGQPHTPLMFSTQPVLEQIRLEGSHVWTKVVLVKLSPSRTAPPTPPPPLPSPLLTEAPELQVNN